MSPRRLDSAQQRVEGGGRGVCDELSPPVVIHLHGEAINLFEGRGGQAGDQRLAGQLSFGSVRDGVTLVGGAAQESTGDDGRVGFDGDAGVPVAAAGLDTNARGEEAWRSLVEHLPYGDPEEHHRAARTAPAVGEPVTPLAARRPGGHVRADSVFEIDFGEFADLADVAFPALRPAEGGHQRLRLAEGKVHPAHPGSQPAQEVLEASEVGQRLRALDAQGNLIEPAAEHYERLFAARGAREVEAVDSHAGLLQSYWLSLSRFPSLFRRWIPGLRSSSGTLSPSSFPPGMCHSITWFISAPTSIIRAE